MSLDSGPRGSEPGADAAPRPISSDDAFAAFYQEKFSPAASWLTKSYPHLAPDPVTADSMVADAFDELYAKRCEIEGDPFKALITEVKRVVDRKRWSPKVRSLDQAVAGGQSSDVSSVTGAAAIADPSARTPDSLTGSVERKAIFSNDAVMSLTAEQRELYDLRWVQDKSWAEIGQAVGLSADAARKRCETIEGRLREFMEKYDSQPTHARTKDERKAPLRVREHALRAIDGLPNPMRALLRAVHLDGLPLAQAALRQKFASKEEAEGVLAKGHALLEEKFGQEIPAALTEALARM